MPEHIDITPEVGMPCTYGIGSDRYAMQVVAIRRGGLTIVAESLNDDGTVGGLRREFTRRNRRGGGYRWVQKGQSYGGLRLGVAETYLDPSF